VQAAVLQGIANTPNSITAGSANFFTDFNAPENVFE
jgi:hypothetical protein